MTPVEKMRAERCTSAVQKKKKNNNIYFKFSSQIERLLTLKSFRGKANKTFLFSEVNYQTVCYNQEKAFHSL